MIALRVAPTAPLSWEVTYDGILVGRINKLANGLYQAVGLDNSLWAVQVGFRAMERWIHDHAESVMDGSVIDQERQERVVDWFAEGDPFLDATFPITMNVEET